MVRRRRRRRLIIGGMLIVGSTSAMRKMSQEDAQKIQQTTGKSPEEMEPEELDQAMAQAGVQSHPVTAEDQQAMASAEANDPNADEEVEAPE
jgi:DNA replication protein DnaD